MIEVFTNTIKWNQSCWRYLKLERFVSSLQHGHMYFAAANEFEDKFEGATCLLHPDSADILTTDRLMSFSNHAFKELQRLTKVSCWHKSDYENDMMWKLYAQQRKGVVICSTPSRMKAAFKPFRLEPTYCEEEIHIGNVKYVDLSSRYINTTMNNIFFYKHRAFSSERELRLVIFLRQAEEFGVRVPDRGIFVQVDYEVLIDHIITGPDLSNEDKDIIYQVCNEYGLKTKIKNSSLTYIPAFL